MVYMDVIELLLLTSNLLFFEKNNQRYENKNKNNYKNEKDFLKATYKHFN